MRSLAHLKAKCQLLLTVVVLYMAQSCGENLLYIMGIVSCFMLQVLVILSFVFTVMKIEYT